MNDQPEVLPGSSKLPTLNLPYLRGWGWNGDREHDWKDHLQRGRFLSRLWYLSCRAFPWWLLILTPE